MKLKCIESIYSIDFKGIRTIINKGDVVISKVMSKEGYCEIFTMDGEYITKITNELMQKYFEPYIEEECTVTTEPTKEIFKGWQIIKMISEGEIKEGNIIENIEEEYTFTYEKGSYFMDLNDLIAGEFKILKPVELISFKEALERNINIKHKDWKIESTTPQNVLNHYTKIENTEILQDLFSDAKVWEVES